MVVKLDARAMRLQAAVETVRRLAVVGATAEGGVSAMRERLRFPRVYGPPHILWMHERWAAAMISIRQAFLAGG